MSDKIDCLGCREELIIPEWVNPDDYEGHVRCDKCNALLYLKYKDGKLPKHKLVEKEPFDIKNIKIQIVYDDSEEDKKNLNNA